jgi:PAS domain S-box-containing protein
MSDKPIALGDRVHQILNNTVAFAALLSADGRLRDVGQNALDAAGIGLEDVLDRPFWECFWFNYDASVSERIRDAVLAAGRGEVSRFDYFARVRNEGRLLIDFQISPILDDDGKVVELLASGFDVTDRERSKAEAQLALREASHRIKNIFAMVRSLARMTRKMSRPETALQDLMGRLDALESVHRLFGGTHAVQDATFAGIVQSVLDPYMSVDHDRIEVRDGVGPVPRDPAKQLGLCLHEMATNAAKYGALSTPTGRIAVSLVKTSGNTYRFDWIETFDKREPPATPPGYGLSYIRGTLGSLLGGDVEIDSGTGRFQIGAEGSGDNLFGQG